MFYIVFLSALVWLTYFYTLKSGFVSDDIAGLQNYDGKLKKFDYGHLNKYLLYKLLDKSPRRNHLFSIILHNANVVLLFCFLLTFISVKIAFYSCILFAIHPICIQSVAWISGRGYPISLFFALLGFNLISIFSNFPAFLDYTGIHFSFVTIAYLIFYYISITAQHSFLTTFAIQLFLGNYFFGIIGAVISLGAGLGIVKEVIGIRTSVFKEQNLGHSTSLKIQKVIVAMKSLAYYTLLCFFPKRLGLYHTFEYHYSEKTERENKWFWLGFLLFLISLAGFWYGNIIVRFAILWYFSYIFVFLNWITVHQFVSERYAYIPVIGICILTAYGISLLDGLFFSGSPVLMALIGGLYLMRTWVHLPTYNNEVSFYQSNIWNFPDSEVAFGNLGVTYMGCNLLGSAVDMWQIAAKINPGYDVALYNISSVLQQRGDFVNAREHLKKAIDSPQCHFRELWTKQLEQLEHEINYIQELNNLNQQLVILEKNPEKTKEVGEIRRQLDEVNSLHKRFEEKQKQELSIIQQEEDQLKTRLIQLGVNRQRISIPIIPTEIIKMRDNNFSFIKETVNNIVKSEATNAKT